MVGDVGRWWVDGHVKMGIDVRDQEAYLVCGSW